MKSVLALVTLALVTLMMEEKARQVAGEAKIAYAEAVDQALAQRSPSVGTSSGNHLGPF